MRQQIVSTRRLIERVTVGAVASVDFTAGFGGEFRQLLWKFHNVILDTDGAIIWARVSNDGGSTFEADANEYRWSTWRHSAATAAGVSTGDTEIQLHGDGNVGSDVSESTSGEVRLPDPAGSEQKHLFWDWIFEDSGGLLFRLSGGGLYQTAEAIDGLQFLSSAGSFESGIIEMYGDR